MNRPLERFISWSVRRIGLPALLPLALLAAVLGSLAAGLTQAIHQLHAAGLAAAALLGLLAGWALARSRLPGWLAAALLALGGIGLALAPLLLAQAQYPPLMDAARSLALELLAWQLGQPAPNFTPFLLLLSQPAAAAGQALLQAGRWAAALARGTPLYDRQAADLFWRLALWTAAAWAAWGVRRWRRPLAGVLPALTLLAWSLSFARAPALPLAPALLATLLLLAWHSFNRRESAWQAAGLDYAEGLSLDVLFWSLSLSAVLVALTLLISSLSPQQALAFSQDWLRSRSPAEQQFGEALGLQIIPTPTGAGPNDRNGQFPAVLPPGLLPRAHLLGSGPELSFQPVMRIRVTLPAAFTEIASPAPRLYWRSQTFDLYTGRGWASSPVQTSRLAAGQPLSPAPTTAGWPVEQQIEPLTDLDGQVFAAGELLSLDQPARLAWRPAGEPLQDIYAAVLDLPTPSAAPRAFYRVRSWLPSYSPLPESGEGPGVRAIPPWLLTRYLQLPPGIPERVLILAQTLTAGEPDAYRKALALESYLRRFPYRLQVPPPPEGRDVADYFLFDLQRGYCDYYATAMVVLARAAGLPARLALGYAPGAYDPRTASYQVTAADAHSWPEIYFPEAGWVIFEPTAAQPAPPHLAWSAAPPPSAAAAHQPLASRRLLLAAAVLGLLALLALPAWLAWDAWRLRRMAPRAAIREIYRRLRRAGQRLRLPPTPAETPHEFAAALSNLPAAGSFEQAAAAALAHLYAHSRYAPTPPGEAEVRQAQALWQAQRLRWYTLRLRLWLAALPRFHWSRKPLPKSRR